MCRPPQPSCFSRLSASVSAISGTRMEEQLLHPILGEITVSRQRRNRRISISVRPSGNVRLSFPLGVPRSRALAFLESKTDWVVAARRRIAERMVQSRQYSDEEIGELRRRAKETLPAKVEHFAGLFGFSYGRVTIRATRSKWGCCTSQNNISLSLFLAALPERLQDYVIIHELCHTVHHNHSPHFHALVDRCLGGREKDLRNELRQYHTM